jgi:hypothetical protein
MVSARRRKNVRQGGTLELGPLAKSPGKFGPTPSQTGVSSLSNF